MSETKKVASKRKLTLNRETLRTIEDSNVRALDGVVGGRPPVHSDIVDCWTVVSSCLTESGAC